MAVVHLAPPRAAPRRVTRRERRALVRRDRVSARLAELAAARALLARAAVRVQAGWVQHAWRAYVGPAGETRVSLLPGAATGPDDAVCLVTGLRSGAPAGQLVDRTLDLVWHTLHGDPAGVRLAAPPDVRRVRVRDLARWNDRRGRTVADVVALLTAADALAGAEMDRLRVSV